MTMVDANEGPPPDGAMDATLESEGMYKSGIGYALWCLFLVGLAGVHRIYLGKYGTGILYLLTFGLFGVGQFIDLFRMDALVHEANVREGYLPHPRWRHLAPPPRARRTEAPREEDEEGRIMRELLAAAQEHGGALSVTQGVAATGLPFKQVEKVLTDMVASGYVDVDNHPETGIVIYRFTELG